MLTVNDFNTQTKQYEKMLNSDYKKENGIFNTDIGLAKSIVEFLNIPTTATVIDACCGTGSFLYSAKIFGVKNVYGADLDKKAVVLSKELTGLESIKKLDTISKMGVTTLKSLGLKKPADYVIGNPPYVPLSKDININTSEYLFLRNVKDAGSNLFIAALYRAFELVKPNGVISYIIPKNFLHISSYALLRKTMLKEKSIISIIDIGKYFKEVRGEQIVLTMQNCFDKDNEIEFFRLIDGHFEKQISISQSFYTDEITLFENQEDFNIYNKLNNTYQKLKDKVTGYVGRGRSKSETAIAGKDIRKFGFKHISVPTIGNQVFIQNIYSAEAGIIASFAGKLEATETVTVFTDGDPKMCHYIVGLLHSHLCNVFLVKYCYNNSSLTMHTDPNYLLRIPLTIDPKSF
ncbi:MAG: N-6 DNA methylase, partial [Clostridiales bacterium]|nr:N-6 DNA methylase [Clostridiales bacterium]